MSEKETLIYVNLWLVVEEIKNEDKMQKNKKIFTRDRHRELFSKSKKNRDKTRDTIKNNSTL